MLSIYAEKTLGNNYIIKEGLKTGDNDYFIKLWYEVSKVKFNIKWFPHTKGGDFRRWYGNNLYLLNYENNGYELCTFKGASLTAKDFYFQPYITYGRIGSGKFNSRYTPKGFIPNMAGLAIFDKTNSYNNLSSVLAITNSKVIQYALNVQNPTLNNPPGVVAELPELKCNDSTLIVVEQNISISKQDWDAHETSWDFEKNELIRLGKEQGEGPYRLADLMEAYKEHWTKQFLQLHANEEELNRQFIDIYGLQNELTPEVPLDEITILQQGEISIENRQIVWHDDVIVKQLISYAVGCMMGRYSIDRKGLILANQGDRLKEYEALVPNSRFAIDDDGIIPLMSVNNELTDHITLRFKTWLSIAFGEENFMDNLNFVERALDKRLEDYFLKDFWKDHKKMYQNRPIYWLFSSKKGAFQCIAYMHRMNAYTAEKVRTQYLLPHIEWLMTRQAEMQANAANLSARERKELDNIGKQIDECREYHDRLHMVADKQIAFDLDDGVVVNYAKFGDVLAKLK